MYIDPINLILLDKHYKTVKVFSKATRYYNV